jgi:hypothetical protein
LARAALAAQFMIQIKGRARERGYEISVNRAH